jgi:hypothetical protein
MFFFWVLLFTVRKKKKEATKLSFKSSAFIARKHPLLLYPRFFLFQSRSELPGTNRTQLAQFSNKSHMFYNEPVDPPPGPSHFSLQFFNLSVPVLWEHNRNKRTVGSFHFNNLAELIIFVKEPSLHWLVLWLCHYFKAHNYVPRLLFFSYYPWPLSVRL